MKYAFILLLSVVLFACKKENIEKPAAPEEVQVMVYATHQQDTATMIASTRIAFLRLK
jgi:hypothetical protein